MSVGANPHDPCPCGSGEKFEFCCGNSGNGKSPPSPANVDQTFQVAFQHHKSGQLPMAEQLYRQILAQHPNHADALHCLGVIAHLTGRHDFAVELIGRSIAVQPNFPEAFFSLGNVQMALRQLDKAIAAYRQAIALNGAFPEAYNNLGNALNRAGQLDESIAAYRRAVAVRSNYPQAFCNLGIALQDKGQFDEAIAACRQAIALNPNYAEAHYNLGNAQQLKGKLDEAIAAYRQAIALKPNYAEACNNLGNALKDKGRLDEAIAACRQAIALTTNYPEAYNNLGITLKKKGQLDEAIAAYRAAIAQKSDFPHAHYNLGIALKDKGQIDEAIAACRQALALKYDYPEAHYNLGVTLQETGRLDEAIAAFRQAIALQSNFPQAYNNLGIALGEKEQLDEAIVAYRQAINLKPNFPEACNNLGNTLQEKGQFDEAIAICRQAIALRANYAEAYSNLGVALRDKGQLDDAIAAYRQAIALKSNYPGAYNNLGIALKEKGQLDEAIAACRRAIALDSNFSDAFNSLGNALKDQGQLDEAIAAFRQAVTLKPNRLQAHSNLVFALHYHPGYDAGTIADECRGWSRQHAEPLRRFVQPPSINSWPGHGNDRSPARRLRIGYVSADLWGHPVGRFLLPLLANHDKSQFEIFAYAQVRTADALTQRLRSFTGGWRNIVGLSDEQVADVVRQDRIDILVDLAMHTADNRLLVFARKPAPVQVTYLAYCSTTGLDTIDYRLSDPYLDPPGEDESIYSETTIRLQSYWCFQPSNAPPDVGPLPASSKGHITFGCLNNFSKVSEPAVAAWAKILCAVPNSSLLVHAHEGSHRQRMLDRLQREGVETRRVQFMGKASMSNYFQLYNGIDISLDTFPYAGGTTTCDALWMGTPVVSLIGRTAVGRGGLSILSNIGLPELAASSPEEYVRLAIQLANDISRLAELRSTLRRRMKQSPLMDAPKFARNIEAAYRKMWEDWCRAIPAGHRSA